MIKDDSPEFQQECANFWSRRIEALREKDRKELQEKQKQKERADMTDEEYADWLNNAVETERKVEKTDMHAVMLSLMFNHPYQLKEQNND